MGENNKADLKIKNILFFLVAVLFIFLFAYYIFAVVPTHGTPILNSTFGTNGTSENLTAFNITTADTEGNPVKSIYQWYLNNTPIAVAVLPFEGGSNNSQTNDTSSFGNSGVVNGAIWANNSGYDGFGAYNFSGVNPNNITLANSQSLNITGNEITLEAWVRINGSDGSIDGTLISRVAPGADGTQYLLDVTSGTPRMILRNRTTTTTLTAITVDGITNVWYHIVGTYNTTNMIIYIDGVQRAIGNFSGNIVPQNVSVRIGENTGGATPLNGTIDDVRIYNVSLTAEQVLAHYRNRTNTIAGSRDLNRTLLRAGDVWNASVHPFDSSGNGTTRFTTSLTLLANASPSHDRPILNSTTGVNTTAENITVYNVSTVDPDGDSVKNIYNWYRNNTAIAVINMPFEGPSDNAGTRDYSPFRNNGTVTGPFWNVTGGYDGKGAYNLDGINDYISIAHSTSFKPSQSMTIAVWVRPHTGSLDEFREIYRKEDGGTRHLFSFQKSSGCSGGGGTGGCLSFGISTGGTYAELDVNIVKADWENSWHFAVATYNGTTKSIYKDGVQIGSASATGAIGTAGTAIAYIGAASGTSEFLNGTVDDFAIYNVSLTAAQVLALYNNRTDVIDTSMLVTTETWNASITPNDGGRDGITKTSTNLTILVANTAPTIETPVFNVSTVTKTSGIAANTTYRDSDSDAGNVFFRWFRNNSEVFTENFTNIAASTIVNSTLSVNLYNRTDLINVTAWANDSTINSTINFSTTLTVANTAPSAETPVFNVSTVTKTSGIAANTTFRDADRDNARVSFRWFRNNSEIFTQNFTNIAVNTIVNSTLSVNLYNRTDLINVTVFADDGNANSTTNFSTTLTVANTAPRVETPVFNVSTVTKTSGIAANTTFRDADRDNSRVSFRWFRNNSEIFTQNFTNIAVNTIVNSTLSVNLYNRTDLINVTVFADDGNANSTTNFSTTLTVANTAPSAETPVFNVSTVTKTSGIAANTTFRDADRDNSRVSFRWFRNNSEIFTQNFTGITVDTIVNSTLSVNLYNRTDLINVTVFADDGNANSTTNFSTTLTVANTAPSAETPVFNVSTVTKTSGIAANTTFRDADRDNSRVSFRWFRNNSEIFTQNFTGITVDTIVNSTLSVNLYNRTDLINVTVFADDGNANSTTNFSTTLTVANTAPTQGTPILNSTLGFNNTDENLTAFNVSVADPDNDGITTYFEWFNNSRSVLNTTTNILSTGNLSGGDNWFVQVIASDLIGNSSPANTSNVTINALSITLFTPENAGRRNNTNQEFTFNTTIAGATICSIFNNASSSFQNRSSISTIARLGNNSINHTSIAEASGIFWNVECISPAGSSVFAPANFTLVIDRTAPNVSRITPITVTSGQDTSFSAIVDDVELSSCSFFLRGSNVGAMTISGGTASRIANSTTSSDIIIEAYANCSDGIGNTNFNATNITLLAVRSGGGDVGEGRAPAASAPSKQAEEVGLVGGTKYANLEVGSVIVVSPTSISYPITVKSIYPNSVRLDIGGMFNFILLKETVRSFDLNGDMMDDIVIYIDDVVPYSRVTLTVLELQNAPAAPTSAPFFEDLGAIWEKVIGSQEQEVVQEPEQTEYEKELTALRQIITELQNDLQEKEEKISALEFALQEGSSGMNDAVLAERHALETELAELREEFKALLSRLTQLESTGQDAEQTGETAAFQELPVPQATKIQFQELLQTSLQTSEQLLKNTIAALRQKGSITGAFAVEVSTDFVVKKVVTSREMRMLALTMVLIGLVTPLILSSYAFQRFEKKKRDEIDAHLEKELRYRGLN